MNQSGEASNSDTTPIPVIQGHRTFYGFLTWLTLGIMLGMLPFAASFYVLPLGRPWVEILWHGDIFILTNTLMAASMTDLILSQHAPERAKALLITAAGIIIFVGIFFYTIGAGNEAAITAHEAVPFPRFSRESITAGSLILFPAVVLISAVTLFATSGQEGISGRGEEGSR